jgi:nicotinamidase-related amidase
MSVPFLTWLSEWEASLLLLSLADIEPETTAVISEDLLKGFCDVGPLSGPRAQGIVPQVVALFAALHQAGVRHFLLMQDTHEEQALEFEAFPPHCVAGSEESETIPELLALPFSEDFVVFEKNSISSTVGTGLLDWLVEHPEITTFIVVGVCTDICVYELAMDLRMRANAQGERGVRVIVPADCVQTYDTSVETAAEIGAMPHDGDLLHRIFLYQMALNAIEVVDRIE